jgi:hypothetical protein
MFNSDEKKFIHEISTPLSVILFQLEAAIKSNPPQEARDRLQQALEQTKKIVASLEARREALKAL